MNIKEIQRRLGHSTMEITSRRYVHVTNQMERESIEIMNRMYGDKSGEKGRLRLVY